MNPLITRAEQKKGYDKYFFQEIFSSSKLLTCINVIQNIPNINLKLTDEEIKTITHTGNSLVIGRSGTGKTTCIVLKMLLMELIYYLNQQTLLKKSQLQNNYVLKSVFITASPILANQIQKYYRSLVLKIREEIKKVQSSKQQKPEEILKEEESSISIMMSSFQQVAGDGDDGTESSLGMSFEPLEESFFSQLNFDEITLLDLENEDHKKDLSDLIDDEDIFQDDEGYDIFQISDQAASLQSLKHIQPKQYPLFTTIRTYLKLIDGYIPYKFFDFQKKEVTDSTTISKYDSLRLLDKVIISQNCGYLQISHIPNSSYTKCEIDYRMFSTIFWPEILRKFPKLLRITASSLWVEIISFIKGSNKSHTYLNRFLPREVYLKLKTSSLLDEEQKTLIYSMFEVYEEWKKNKPIYDLLDLVNHLLREMGKDVPSISFTMIDEVQDLPQAAILLFTRINQQHIIYAGDSAQTISRGAGFRFKDLKGFLNKEFQHKFNDALQTHKLTVNFRSHNKILQLSNSVVSIIEGLFPSTIDVMKKERSNINGIKPIILDDPNLELVSTLLKRQSEFSESLQEVQFGCNQVVIVKDEQSKSNLPDILKHSICLTIFEAKGLEFDDVILFNFFTDSICNYHQWEAISLLNIGFTYQNKEDFLKEVAMIDRKQKEADLNSEEKEDNDDNDEDFDANILGVEFDEINNQVKVGKITKDPDFQKYNSSQNFSLCSELKQLYTGITRPRKRLIIIDTDSSKRKCLEKFWKEQNLVLEISHSDFEIAQKPEGQKMTKEIEEKISAIKSLNSLQVSNTSQEWFEQGMNMYKRKYFDQAVFCFKQAGNEIFQKRSAIYKRAQGLQNDISKLENELMNLTHNFGEYSAMNEHQKQKYEEQLTATKNIKIREFNQVGEEFLTVNRQKAAAQCFFSAKQLKKAAVLYEKIGNKLAAAQCYSLIPGSKKRAGELFEELNEIPSAVKQYEYIGDYEKANELIFKHENPSEFFQHMIYLKKQFFERIKTTYSNNNLIKQKNKNLDEELDEIDFSLDLTFDDLMSETEKEQKEDHLEEEIQTEKSLDLIQITDNDQSESILPKEDDLEIIFDEFKDDHFNTENREEVKQIESQVIHNNTQQDYVEYVTLTSRIQEGSTLETHHITQEKMLKVNLSRPQITDEDFNQLIKILCYSNNQIYMKFLRLHNIFWHDQQVKTQKQNVDKIISSFNSPNPKFQIISIILEHLDSNKNTFIFELIVNRYYYHPQIIPLLQQLGKYPKDKYLYLINRISFEQKMLQFSQENKEKFIQIDDEESLLLTQLQVSSLIKERYWQYVIKIVEPYEQFMIMNIFQPHLSRSSYYDMFLKENNSHKISVDIQDELKLMRSFDQSDYQINSYYNIFWDERKEEKNLEKARASLEEKIVNLVQNSIQSFFENGVCPSISQTDDVLLNTLHILDFLLNTSVSQTDQTTLIIPLLVQVLLSHDLRKTIWRKETEMQLKVEIIIEKMIRLLKKEELSTTERMIKYCVMKKYGFIALPNSYTFSAFGKDQMIINKNQRGFLKERLTNFVYYDQGGQFIIVDTRLVIEGIIFQLRMYSQYSFNQIESKFYDYKFLETLQLADDQQIKEFDELRIKRSFEEVQYSLSKNHSSITSFQNQFGDTDSILSETTNIRPITKILVYILANKKPFSKNKLILPESGHSYLENDANLQMNFVNLKDVQRMLKSRKEEVIVKYLPYYDNDYINTLCNQMIEKVNKEFKSYKTKPYYNYYDDCDYQEHCYMESLKESFCNILIILINCPSLKNEILLELLNLIDIIIQKFSKEEYISKEFIDDDIYNDLIESQTLEEARESAIDLVYSEMFEDHFEYWVDFTYSNQPDQEIQTELIKRYLDEPLESLKKKQLQQIETDISIYVTQGLTNFSYTKYTVRKEIEDYLVNTMTEREEIKDILVSLKDLQSFIDRQIQEISNTNAAYLDFSVEIGHLFQKSKDQIFQFLLLPILKDPSKNRKSIYYEKYKEIEDKDENIMQMKSSLEKSKEIIEEKLKNFKETILPSSQTQTAKTENNQNNILQIQKFNLKIKKNKNTKNQQQLIQ